jgi:hypothetical protein
LAQQQGLVPPAGHFVVAQSFVAQAAPEEHLVQLEDVDWQLTAVNATAARMRRCFMDAV